MRQQVAALDWATWRSAAIDCLSPYHPALCSKSTYAIRQGIHASKQARSGLSQGSYTRSLTIADAFLPVFSPCATAVAVLARTRPCQARQPDGGGSRPASSWYVVIFAVRRERLVARILLDVHTRAIRPRDHYDRKDPLHSRKEHSD